MKPSAAAACSLALLLCVGCDQERTVTVAVGDPAKQVWIKLERRGHRVARIPLDGRIEVQEPSPDGGPPTSRVVGMIVPYDIDGRIVEFTHDYESDTVTGITVEEADGGLRGVEELAIPAAGGR